MKQRELGSAIRKIAYNETSKNIGVITEDGSFRILNNTLDTLSGFKTNFTQENNFRQTQFVSNSLKYLALCKPKSNQAVVMDIANKKALFTISKNSGEIETIFIDVQDKYLVSGGMDGRTYIYDLKTGHFLYNLQDHTDFVTAIAMTNTTQLIATGSFDGTILLTNLNTLRNTIKLQGHQSYIVGIEFLNKGKLVSAEKNGNVIIFDFNQKKISKRMKKIPDEITAMKVDPNKEFLFIGTKLGKVAVYELKTETLLSDNLKKFPSAVTDLFITKDGNLIIGLRNGTLIKEKLIDEEKYLALYESERYADIYLAFEKSPFVIYSQAYAKIETKWESSLHMAKEFLANQKKEEAKKVLEQFNTIPKKRTIIKTVLNEFEEFSKFQQLVEKKRYALAYPLVLKYTSLEETKEYRTMESDWKKRFNKAQDIILDPRSDELVADLLKDFKGIPSKTKQIQQLLKEKTIFNMLKKRLDSKNYKEIFIFVNKYPFLKELDIYKQLLKFVDATYTNLTKAMSRLDYSKVRGYLEILEEFEEYKESISEIKHEMKVLMQLVQYCQLNDRKKVYEIIDTLNYTVELECIEKLQEEWQTTVEKAYVLSAKADVQGIIELFEDFFTIESKNNLIKKIILSAYRRKMEYFMQKSGQANEEVKKNLQNKILSLENMFGSIEEIKSLDFSFQNFYGKNVGLNNEKAEKPISKKMYEEYFSNI